MNLIVDMARATFIVKLRGRRYRNHVVLIKRKRGEMYVTLTLVNLSAEKPELVRTVDSLLTDTELRMIALDMLRNATVLTP